ncbi:MAG: hypothetical protein LC130_20935 [Bryobacterales bacterium]|nr:hypothetical protein [Bryobacterales bacterium]
MITRKRLLCSVVPAGVAIVALHAIVTSFAPLSPAAEPTVSADPFSGPPRSEAQQLADRRLFDQQQQDERQITIRQANAFHVRFAETVLPEMPWDVTFQYSGPLYRIGHQRQAHHNAGRIANTLHWLVVGRGIVAFDFWISTQPTTETVTDTMIEGQKIFVNVSHVNANRGLDAPLGGLGGLTVRQTLAKLNKPWPAPPDGPGQPNRE